MPEEAITPRSLRHAFATAPPRRRSQEKLGVRALARTSDNLRVVQALLGHQSLNTTAVYVHLARTWLAEVKSPLDQLKDKAQAKT